MKLGILHKIGGIFGLLVLVFSAVASGTYLITMRVANDGINSSERLGPLGNAVLEIELNTARVDQMVTAAEAGQALLFEDISEKIDDIRFFSNAILNGDTSTSENYFATDSATVRNSITGVNSQLDILESAIDNRMQVIAGQQGVGSQVDIDFDHTYDLVLVDVIALSEQPSAANDPRVQYALGQVQYLLAHGHLMTEEILGGDEGENFEVEVASSFRQARSHLTGLFVNNNQLSQDAIELSTNIQHFSDLARTRYERMLELAEISQQTRQEYESAYESFLSETEEARQDINASIHDSLAGLKGAKSESAIMVLGGIGVFLVLIAGGFWLSYQMIVAPAGKLSKAATDMASGNIHVHIPEMTSKDEIGDLGRSVHEFQKAMVERSVLAAKMEEDELHREEQRRKLLLEVGQDLNMSMEKVISSLMESASGLGGAVAQLRDSNSQSTAMIIDSRHASTRSVETIESSAAASEELSASISETMNQADAACQMVQAVVGSAQNANSRMTTLSETANKIGEVLGFIQDIAEQTNLLALNATIEAARAGEAGKGFAVVASEVKQLASQTEKATGDIKFQISEIQDAVVEAVNEVKDISSALNDVEERAKSISTTVSQQREATAEIASSSQTAANESIKVAELANALDETAGRMKHSTEQVAELSGTVDTQINHMRSSVSEFVEKLSNTG